MAAVRLLVPPILLLLVFCTLQRLLDGLWAARRRSEAEWQLREDEAHLRWTRAIYAAQEADDET